MTASQLPYDAVLFDLDGTLTQSGPGIIASARHAAEQMGLSDMEDSVFARFMGPPLYYSFQTYLGLEEDRAHEAVQHYRDFYRREGMFRNAVYPFIPHLLKALREKGIRMGIATGKPKVFTDQILAHYGLTGYFEKVVGVSLSDTDADKRQLVRDALPEGARRPVMVGDRKFDVLGAKDNGMDSIGVLYGYGSGEELSEAGASFLARDVQDLGRLLLGGDFTPKGLFVSMEGLDGSGKSSQMDRLAEYLQLRGYPVRKTREPGGSPMAEKIRHLVLDPTNEGVHAWTEALLYAASRAQHVRDVIRPALEGGEVVICDRFVDSSVAYQGAGRQLGIRRVMDVNEPAVDGVYPDVTVLFRIDPQTAMARRAGASSLDRIEKEDIAFFTRVFEAFETLAAENVDRYRVVDSSQGQDEVAEQVRAVFSGLLDG